MRSRAEPDFLGEVVVSKLKILFLLSLHALSHCTILLLGFQKVHTDVLQALLKWNIRFYHVKKLLQIVEFTLSVSANSLSAQ